MGDAPLADQMIDASIDAPPGVDAPVSPYAYRRRITITNTSSVTLPVGFTIRVPFPALGPLVAAQKVRIDYRDLRVIADGAASENHRIVDGIGGPAPSAVSFALTKAIPAGTSSMDYALYYGNPTAGVAPENGAMVFAIYDAFSNGIDAFWNINDAPTTTAGHLVLRANHLDALTTTAASDNVPIVSAVEISARAIDPQSDPTVQTEGTFWYWFGYQHTGDFAASDPWVVWIARGKGIVHAEQSSPVGCEAGCGGPDITQNTAFHYYAIERDVNATRFYRDGALSYTATVTNNADYAVLLRNYMATSNVEVDFVRARARVSPDPTIVVGNEESL